MRVENMITQVKFSWFFFNSRSPILLLEMYGDEKKESVFGYWGKKYILMKFGQTKDTLAPCPSLVSVI